MDVRCDTRSFRDADAGPVHYDEPQVDAPYVDESVRALAVHARKPRRDGSIRMGRRVLGVGDHVLAGATGRDGGQGGRAAGARRVVVL